MTDNKCIICNNQIPDLSLTFDLSDSLEYKYSWASITEDQVGHYICHGCAIVIHTFIHNALEKRTSSYREPKGWCHGDYNQSVDFFDYGHSIIYTLKITDLKNLIEINKFLE